MNAGEVDLAVLPSAEQAAAAPAVEQVFFVRSVFPSFPTQKWSCYSCRKRRGHATVMAVATGFSDYFVFVTR